MKLELLCLLPLSSTVLLVRTAEGWRLSDGYRFTAAYPSADDALNDQATRRALTFGEDLPAEGGPAQ